MQSRRKGGLDLGFVRLTSEALEPRRLLTTLYVAPSAADWVSDGGVGTVKSTIHPSVTGLVLGTTAFTDIGSAVTAAASGDTVEIMAGNYHPGSAITPTVTNLTIKDYSADTVNVIRASGAFVIDTTGTQISGLTISSNSGTGIAVQSGGGLYLIFGNSFQTSLVGVSVDDTGTISSNIFSGETTGILASGGIDTISSNSIGGGANVGIQVSGGAAAISGTTFGSGGANMTDLQLDSGSITSLTGNTFTASSTYIDNEAYLRNDRCHQRMHFRFFDSRHGIPDFTCQHLHDRGRDQG